MQALLEHSKINYGPLPLELRVRRTRSRTNSRPSPYPQRMAPVNLKATSPLHINHNNRQAVNTRSPLKDNNVLMDVSELQNVLTNSPAPVKNEQGFKAPLSVKKSRAEHALENDRDVVKPKAAANPYPRSRERVGSGARRAALGWSKRKTPNKKANKENMSLSQSAHEGMSTSLLRYALHSFPKEGEAKESRSPNDSLRIVRPRPNRRVRA